MKIIVLGASGMLGGAVAKALSTDPELEVWGTFRAASAAAALALPRAAGFEAFNGAPAFERLLADAGRCDVFVNCIAMLKPDIDESDAKSVLRAEFINGEFPRLLTAVARKIGARVVHVSTDGVFSGNSSEPYFENSRTDAEDIYGRTKARGEIDAPELITFRSSFIGLDPVKHRGLLEWLLSRPDGEELTGFTDHIWHGATTGQFASFLSLLLRGDYFLRLRNESPIHHFAPNKPLSKHELLDICRKIFNKNVSIRAVQSPGGPARRTLGSRSQVLPELLSRLGSLEDAIRELAVDYQQDTLERNG